MLDPQNIRTFGPYTLLSQIGMGGMAEVYLALRKGPQNVRKPVALKCILGPYANLPEFTDLFLHEARISMLANHPNVVQTWDCTVIEGRYTMVMEYLNGVTLDKILAQLKSTGTFLPIGIAIRIALQMLEALDYLHQMTDEFEKPLNLVHRDLSPQNICVCFDGQCKLFDFGVSRYGDSDLQKGMLVGKCAYMSPEQCHGLQFDSRSDLFALAAILYEMTTGIPAFARDDDIQTLNALTSLPIVPPVEQIAGYPPTLSQIVMNGLQRDPQCRYQTAAQFAEDLRTCAQTLSIHIPNMHQLADWMSMHFARQRLDHRSTLTQAITITDRIDPQKQPPSPSFTDMPKTGQTLTVTMQSLDIAISKLTHPSSPSIAKPPPIPKRK